MKKFLSFLPILSFALALLFLGCSNPSAPDGIGVDPVKPLPPIPGDKARVIIPLPSAARLSRLGVPITEAQQFADRYEVFFTNKSSGSVITASEAKGKASIIVDIPEGTYDILLLATENKGSSPLLLASSYVLSKSVSLAIENKVEMTMASIHLEISAPLKVPVLKEYDVGFTFNPQNPLLTSPGQISYSVNNIQYQDHQWDTSSAKVGMQYGYDVTLEAPLNTGISEIVFRAAYVTVKGSGNQDKSYRFANADHTELGKYFRTAIEFVKAGEFPELGITIVWPTEETPPPPRPIPVRFTLTGIPSQYQNLYMNGGSLSLSLLSPDGKTVAWGQSTMDPDYKPQATMSFSLRTTGTQYDAPLFTETGDHKAVLRVKKDFSASPEILEYSMNVRSGTNSVAWTSFKQSEFISLQVTQLNQYYNEASIYLVTEDGKTVAWGNSNWDRDVGQDRNNPTFMLRAGQDLATNPPLFSTEGRYKVILLLSESDGMETKFEQYEYKQLYVSLGNNTISWHDFSHLPPIGITVKNIPDQYQYRNLYGAVALLPRGSNDSSEIEGQGTPSIIYYGDIYLPVYIAEGNKSYDIILAFLKADSTGETYEGIFRANNVSIYPAGTFSNEINFQNFTQIDKLPWE